MTESELRQLVTAAEREGQTPRLYRLWCEHIVPSKILLMDEQLTDCDACGIRQPVMYRVTPQSDPELWPN